MDNRLHLNFNRGEPGAAGYENDDTYQASNERVYPTTPSTFPQPVFQNQAQANSEYLSGGTQSPTGGYPGGANYFSNNLYQAQYAQPQPQQQQQAQQQQQQQQHQQQQGQYSNQYQQGITPQSQRQGGLNTNDPTTGLARQFSNQNLGSSQQRQLGPFNRQPSPNTTSRPRTGDLRSQQSYGSTLSPSLVQPGGLGQSGAMEDPPEQNFDKYSSNVAKRVVGLHVHVQAFFKDNISRARERNTRAKELELALGNPGLTPQEKRDAAEKLWITETQHLRYLRTIESAQNFSTVKVIGKGAFGEVKLVQRKTDGKIYALKCLVKAEMFKKDQLAHVRAERDILAEADSPWVVKLYTTFQDKAFLYMLMEFLPGGDLMTMLIKYETFSPDIARFYMAEILLAIEAVHKLGFIHRDIKPDNILLDVRGHLKLTDFGLSTGFHKQHEASYYQQLLRGTSSNRSRENRQSVNLDQINLTVSNRGQINNWRKSRRTMAYSTVGTPDYIAPEIFSGQGYSFSCDWWSLGAIMYESVIGWPPFCAEDPHDTYRKIVDWKHTLYFPDDLPTPLEYRAEHLIRSLLCDSPHRLGSSGGSHGAGEIKQHPYFANVDWDTMRQMQAPFQPKLENMLDTEYFPIDDIDQTDHSAEWEAQAQSIAEEHEAEMTLPFIGYTYKRFEPNRQ